MKLTNKTNGTSYSVEVESLPAYFKSPAHNIKLISETECIWVTNSKDILTYECPVFLLANDSVPYQPSDKNEFNQAFKDAITYINTLNDKINGNQR